jgi:excisionase family DNA binding protein
MREQGAGPVLTTPSLLVAVAEAARLLSCSRTTVKLLIRRGEIRAVKLGRLTRIPRRHLDEYVMARVETASPHVAVAALRTVRRGSACNIRRG